MTKISDEFIWKIAVAIASSRCFYSLLYIFFICLFSLFLLHFNSVHIWKWRKFTKLHTVTAHKRHREQIKMIINNNNTWEINNKEKTVHTKKETQNIRVSRDTPRMLEYVLSVRCLQTNSSTYVKVSYSLAYSQSTLRPIHNSISNYYNQP